MKIPISVLVLIHTRALDVLLIERVNPPGFWQSVTGSLDPGETPVETAVREVFEETGLDARAYPLVDWKHGNVFEIYPMWRHRYPEGTLHNTEHVFGLTLPAPVPVKLEPREHVAQTWLPWERAAEKVFSWSNRDAILMLPERPLPDR